MALDGYLTSSPAASGSHSSTEVCARGGDGALWFNDGGGWTSFIGGRIYPGTAPAIVSWGTGDDFFVKGMDGALWFWNGQWTSLGGGLTSSPGAALSPQCSVIHCTENVFVRGNNNGLWEKTAIIYPDPAHWTDWYNIGGGPP